MQLDHVMGWSIFQGTLNQWLSDKDMRDFRIVQITHYSNNGCVCGPRRAESKDRRLVAYENNDKELPMCMVLNIDTPRKKAKSVDEA